MVYGDEEQVVRETYDNVDVEREPPEGKRARTGT